MPTIQIQHEITKEQERILRLFVASDSVIFSNGIDESIARGLSRLGVVDMKYEGHVTEYYYERNARTLEVIASIQP